MKKISKIFASILALLSLVTGAFALAACDEEPAQQTGPVSALRGTFTYNESIGGTGDVAQFLTVTNDQSLVDAAGQRSWLYGSYTPFNVAYDWDNQFNLATPHHDPAQAAQNRRVAVMNYRINQQLRLNRDFTYSYVCSVVISNPCQWGSEIGRLEASVTGTFTSEAGEGTQSAVTLSDPTGGSLELYGISAGGDTTGYYWMWRVHDVPDVVQNYDYADCFEAYGKTEVYKYVAGRVVTVDTEDSSLSDDLFDPYLFDLMAQYGTY